MQSATSQSASNNLQLCYQKYLSVVCFRSQSVLKTRKQNYIIIVTSLSGSFMLFRFLQKKFFQQIVENYVEKLLKLLKTKQSIPFTQTVNIIYIPSHLSKLTKNISTSLCKLTILYHIYHTTIYCTIHPKIPQIPQQIVQPKIHFKRHINIISLPHQTPRITHFSAF